MDIKEKCMGFYDKAYRFTENGDFEEAAINIRHALEEVLKEFTRRHTPAHIYDDTFTQIEALKQSGLFTETSINSFHSLRKLGNRGGHVDSDAPLTKQELKDALPILKKLIDSACTPPPKTEQNTNQPKQPLRTINEVLNDFFFGRTMYADVPDNGVREGGVKVSFNDNTLVLEYATMLIQMHVTGINKYNVLQYDKATINGEEIPPEKCLIKITKLTCGPNEWGQMVGQFAYQINCDLVPKPYCSVLMFYDDTWTGQSLKKSKKKITGEDRARIIVIMILILLAIAQFFIFR